jgi:hypothetical protein
MEKKLKKLIDDEWAKTEVFSEIDSKGLPSQKQLKLKDGYYVNALSISIDMVDSTKMMQEIDRRSTQAKIYRIFHMVILHELFRPFNISTYSSIVGDGSNLVISVQSKEDISKIMRLLPEIKSGIDYFNSNKLNHANQNIKFGIGVECGDMLMYKYKGNKSIIWPGLAVNYSSKLSSLANRNKVKEIVLGEEMSKKFGFAISSVKGLNGYQLNIDQIADHFK